MTYVIVGASAGLGRALATQFAAAGHDLILVASDERDLLALVADLTIKYGVKAIPIAADVSVGDGYLDGIARAGHDMGGIDGLLFPLGASLAEDDCSYDPVRAAWITQVNYGSVVSGVTRLLPSLLSRPRASVVGFGSVAALRGRHRNVTYAAAKRALQTFFESLRHRCAGSPLKIQFYVLGYMDTELARGLRSPIPKGNVNALSREVLRRLDRDLGVVYYPRFWKPLSLVVRGIPWWVFRRLDA